MNNKWCYLVFVLLIVACKRDVDEDSHDENCIQLSQHADWTKTEFRTNYTIQFPNSYTVTKSQGYEGTIYNVKRDDNSVLFHYIYCASMVCYGNAEGLSSLPDFIDIPTSASTRLDKKVSFCNGNEQTGALYYNSNSNAMLYWKENGKYKEALNVTYNPSSHQEVLDIIKTIKEK